MLFYYKGWNSIPNVMFLDCRKVLIGKMREQNIFGLVQDN